MPPPDRRRPCPGSARSPIARQPIGRQPTRRGHERTGQRNEIRLARSRRPHGVGKAEWWQAVRPIVPGDEGAKCDQDNKPARTVAVFEEYRAPARASCNRQASAALPTLWILNAWEHVGTDAGRSAVTAFRVGARAEHMDYKMSRCLKIHGRAREGARCLAA